MTKLSLIKIPLLNLNHIKWPPQWWPFFLRTPEKIMSNKKIKTRVADKNLQDDWIPDATRKPGATSDDLPEYGGDLKETETIEKESKQAEQANAP